jgi:hypothetical protein
MRRPASATVNSSDQSSRQSAKNDAPATSPRRREYQDRRGRQAVSIATEWALGDGRLKAK